MYKGFDSSEEKLQKAAGTLYFLRHPAAISMAIITLKEVIKPMPDGLLGILDDNSQLIPLNEEQNELVLKFCELTKYPFSETLCRDIGDIFSRLYSTLT